MKTKLLLTILFTIGVIGFTQAQPGQRARIHEGIKSGELTRSETARLQHDERMFHRDRRRSMRDGHLSRAERRHLRMERKRHSREIFRMKHNRHERHFF